MTLRVKMEGRTLTATLARPEKRNAFDASLRTQLRDVVVAPGASARVLVLRAEGDVFSAGNDLAMIAGARAAGPAGLAEQQLDDLELLTALYACRIPTIAVVDGPVYGFAADIVSAIDWVVGSPSASFRWPEIAHGIVPAGDAVERAGRAATWSDPSHGLSAEAARACGLLDELVDSDPAAHADRRARWIADLPEPEFQGWRARVLHERTAPLSLWSRLPGLWLPGAEAKGER